MRCLTTTVILVSGLMMTPGCGRTRDVEFDLGDAGSLEPLSGVRVDLFDRGCAKSSVRRSDLAYGPSAADGALRVRFGEGHSENLDFSKEDYHRSSAVVRPDLRQVGIVAPAVVHDTATPRQVPLGGRVV